MGVGNQSWVLVPPPTVASELNMERDDHWRHFDNSVNAVSFGFVATAILISMFLVMAIFERFLRPRSTLPTSTTTATNGSDLEAQLGFNPKLNYPSPKVHTFSFSAFIFSSFYYLGMQWVHLQTWMWLYLLTFLFFVIITPNSSSFDYSFYSLHRLYVNSLTSFILIHLFFLDFSFSTSLFVATGFRVLHLSL